MPVAGRKPLAGFSAYTRASRAWPRTRARICRGGAVAAAAERAGVGEGEQRGGVWGGEDTGTCLVLCEGEALARSDAQLPLDEVKPRDHLRHGVLHLGGEEGGAIR